MDIREKSDAGEPLVATAPTGSIAAIYRDIAAKVQGELKSPSRPPPKIIIEA
jgi:ATP-binding protein involved in chromosome partitioning